jgi:AraC-like DNA-binding protein
MQRRLEEAYQLLRSDKNITEIAYEVGFETPAHFIASFKEKYGGTPKQLQQRL